MRIYGVLYEWFHYRLYPLAIYGKWKYLIFLASVSNGNSGHCNVTYDKKFRDRHMAITPAVSAVHDDADFTRSKDTFYSIFPRKIPSPKGHGLNNFHFYYLLKKYLSDRGD